jgi:glycosyltransferase involved in cell wall biosynthesis
MARMLFEGWRFSPTSYAVVLQSHLLDIMRRTGAEGHELFFRDIPFHTNWPHVRNLLPAADEARLEALREPPPGTPLDVSFRMAHPTLVSRTDAASSWCWIVTEFGILEQTRIGDGRPVAEALRTPGVRIMTCSNWSKQGLLRSGADPDNVVVVPCGFDPALMRPASAGDHAELRKALGWEGRFVFLNVSTLTWNKGIAMLLMAFAMVLDRHPHALLVIKGNEEMLSSSVALKKFLTEAPPERARRVAANIRYLGQHLSASQIADLYRAADAYVAPYHAEGFNLPVMEAAACGLPVICTDGGPTDDFTTPEFCRRIPSVESQLPALQEPHGRGARVLLPDGPMLINLMTDIVTNDSFRLHALTAGPKFLCSRFTWRLSTDRFLQALLSDAHRGSNGA